MRILLTEGDLERHGGQEVVTLEVARGLAARGHAVDVLFHRRGSLEPEYRAFARSLRRAPGIAPDRHRVLGTALGSAAMAARGLVARPEVVYVNQAAMALEGSLIAGAQRAPLVCHLHLPPTRWPLPLRIALRRVDRFITVSHATKQRFVADGFDGEAIDVVHNAVDTERFSDGDGSALRRRLGLPPQAFVVLYAGRLDPPKGVEVLLEAFGRLGLDPANARLVIAGQARGGSSPAVTQAYAARLRRMLPASACTWLPFQDDVVSLYRAADVVVLPSLWAEPFPLVPMEAMACGRPVVASRVGGIPEILHGNLQRFLVPPGDAPALAAHLNSLRDWRRRQPGLTAEVRRHVVTGFSLQRQAGAVEGILTDVVARGRRRPRTPARRPSAVARP
jgi:glycosyltransferase involved in cell wall biosynthesis